ncbi:GAP family protein [Georgenia halophila]|uniref:GAP family protein n=1 Tax=Georgenia halophila TaxID=620889 RepID=A0ABP8L5P4_9MICO
MDLSTVGLLGLLALADSTSFGTLLIPIWLLLVSGRPRPGRLLVYLGTVAGFYFVVGLLLSVGAGLFLTDIQAWTETDAGAAVLVVTGAALIVAAFLIDRRRKVGRNKEGGGRLLRWRDRVMSAESGSARPLMALALTATAAEVASMLPYLVAIGVMTDADLPPAAHLGVLAAYCLVMIVPALMLLALRLVAHRVVQPLLVRINDWLTRSAGDWMPWIVGILGFLLLSEGADQLPGVHFRIF